MVCHGLRTDDGCLERVPERNRSLGKRGRQFCSVLLGASALALPQMASAATAREAALEARLQRLEAEMMQLRTDLIDARQQQVETTAATTAATTAITAQNAQAETRLNALEARPQAPAEGFTVGGTTFGMGGFIKLVASSTRYSAGEMPGGQLAKELYLPQFIPVGGAPSRDFIAHARQSRIFFTSSTPAGSGEIKGHVEFDFALGNAPAGAQRSTNAYSPTFRRGFLTYGNWLAGQEWTNFQNPAYFPETTDFAGQMEGSVFVRQAIVRYRQPIAQGIDLFVSAENPQTETITTTSAALVDHDTDHVPDVTARLAVKRGAADFHVAGLVRQLSVEGDAGASDALGWGVSAGGKFVFGPEGRHDLRFVATYGHGIGRYLSAGFVPDAVYDLGALGNDRLHVIDNVAGFAALKLGWADNLRSTFMAGFQHAGMPDNMLLPELANRNAYSFAGNLFWSPVSKLDLGIEYRHALREVVNGQKGRMDRFEMAAKYTF